MSDISNNNQEVLAQDRTSLAHSAAELAYKLYYEQDRKGLDMLIKDLETVLTHTRNCIDCLAFLNRQGESAGVHGQGWH